MRAAMLKEELTWASPSAAETVPERGESYASAEEPNHGVCSIFYPGPRMQLTTVLQVPGRTYKLRGVFVIDVEHLPDGVVFVTHRALPVHGYGIDQSEAFASFCESFDMQWRSLVEVEQDNLTEGGRARSHALAQSVEEVVPEGGDVGA